MTRDFLPTPVDASVLEGCIDLASRSPSAGKSQGWNIVLLEGSDTRRYWDIALPADRRTGFAFPGLIEAPVLMIVCADPGAYLDRYSEPDKTSTGLGAGESAWPAPYWTVDASFATMTLLLALENAGLGALFFAHASERELRRQLEIPDPVVILGVIAAGHRHDGETRPGRSASRPRRDAGSIVHRGRW